MTMRSYSGLLLFENAFDYIPNGNPDFLNLSNTLFHPDMPIVEEDCETTLGRFEVVNFEAEGLVELSTGMVFTRERIEQLLSQGIYETAVRHTSTCISKGGVCLECYKATFPDRQIPKVMDRVNVDPEFLVNAEVIAIEAGETVYTFNTDPDSFTKHYLFSQGSLLMHDVDYHTNGNIITLTSTPDSNRTAVMRCIRSDTAPYMAWLANTYSGSLLGMQSLPSQPLPVRSLLLTSMLAENRLQLVSDYLKQMQTVPSNFANYLDQIRDPLEKALFMLALYCIYSNVTL